MGFGVTNPYANPLQPGLRPIRGDVSCLTVDVMTSTMQFLEATKTTEAVAATKGWHADPQGRHDLRFHDGTSWTEHVTHFGPVPCQGCNPFAD